MRKVRIIGVPLDLGQERRGVDMGPSALRVADLNARIRELGFEVDDAGNVAVPIREMQHPGNHRAKYLKAISQACKRQATWVMRTLRQGYFPLVLGGDHSIAVGTVAGVAEYYRKKGKKVGLIWVDAHADMNTPETSPSGNVHGMPLACCLGYGPRELAHLFDTAGFCVTLDMDFVDPTEAPGVGTPVRGGATYREAHLVMEMVADASRMLSLEIVEVNPVIDVANKTAALAVELL